MGLDAKAGPLLDVWLYEAPPGADVLILTYGCFADDLSGMACSEEHTEVGLFELDELDDIDLPEGYRSSILAWHRRRGLGGRF